MFTITKFELTLQGQTSWKGARNGSGPRCLMALFQAVREASMQGPDILVAVEGSLKNPKLSLQVGVRKQ